MKGAIGAAREALKHAAATYATKYPEDGQELLDLCRAASAYHVARVAASNDAASTQSHAGPRSGAVVPFGKTKGLPIEEETTKGLLYLRDAMQRGIDDPSKERWRESNQKLKAHIEAELARRGEA